ADGDMEVYSIDEVTTIEDSSATVRTVNPYYTVEHVAQPDSVYWHGERSLSLHQTGHRRGVTDFHLTLSTLDKTLAPLDHHTLHVKALCSNANLPAHLPFGGGTPHFAPEEPISGLKRVSSVTPPTPVRRLSLDQGILWRLLSHFNLSFLSLVGAGDAAAQLREALRLYDFGDSPTSKAIIDAVDAVATKVISLPIMVDGRPVVCRGIDCVLTFDVSILETNSAFLLGDTLQRFMSKYVSINSFVRVTVKIKSRDGIVKRWEPIVGTRLVL
ncbi:MAG: type VI secretion system baseplate subunit TssF, partial [Pseudomonadota bacterium]